MAITPVFQADDAGSIPAVRSSPFLQQYILYSYPQTAPKSFRANTLCDLVFVRLPY